MVIKINYRKGTIVKAFSITIVACLLSLTAVHTRYVFLISCFL